MMEQKDRYIRFDWAVKRLLRNKANFGVLEGFLTVLLGEPIRIVEILESEGNQLNETDKFNRVDIKARNSKDEIIIVEVQNTREIYYLERILFGVAKAITEHIELGQLYSEVKKVYSISILYFDIGRGISGQTSYQFLLRFREDVINLSPALVVINAGTNDVAENTGAYNEDYTFGNIASMAELAKANKIKVILTSVLPAAEFPWRREIKDAPQKIQSLNARIEAYAKANKIPFVNYYQPMVVGENKALNPQYTKDGVHPTGEGYDIMEALIKQAIEKAL